MLERKRVAILVAEGFEQSEMVEPRKSLEKAGAETFIVSPAQDEVQGWNHFTRPTVPRRRAGRQGRRG